VEISFIDLHFANVLFLFVVGFIGGLVSGFIGSGGAFVLTPAMMNMGVPAIMAVASNMCHKFPKALVGAVKRAKYGQVDVKLGLVMGVTAEIGVLAGAELQKHITENFGKAGSNLYVSAIFVLVLAVVGGYVLRDAWKMQRSPNPEVEEVGRLARWIRSVRIPGTMMYFKSIGTEISVLFTIPLGLATGMLAATIAVGGFIGVPAMMYVLGVPGLMASATELVIAFVMGMGGTIKCAWHGYVDIRLAMVILAGSLFGIQLGAIGTTYVRPYMVKLVMGVIMVLVLLSRGVVIPVYLSDLEVIATLAQGTAGTLRNASFAMLVLALAVGGFIVLGALWRGRRLHLREQLVTAPLAAAAATTLASTAHAQLSPMGRLEKLLLVTDGSEFSSGATREAIRLARRCNSRLEVLCVILSNPEYEALAQPLLEKEKQEALAHLDAIRADARGAGLDCETTLRYGADVYQEIVSEADADLIVMGRRGKTDLMRVMLGGTTAKVIGHTNSNVLVVPRNAQLECKRLLLAVDGSRYSDAAAASASSLAKQCEAPVQVVSVATDEQRRTEAGAALDRIVALLAAESVQVEGQVLEGRPDEAIVRTAESQSADLIVMGSHGRTGLERILVGSVSERVIGRAECAVLVARL
jgi:nucleotide-binding universal stress UspA family protein/uncharacterized membrane protein YfcA